MPTLKEILAERKREATQVAQEVSADTEIRTEISVIPQFVISPAQDEFYALFEGIEEF